MSLPPPELLPIKLEVPSGLSTLLRDALLQWRLRHATHPVETEALSSLLAQVDKAFGMLHVQMPEQARLHLVKALLQHQHRHPELALDESAAGGRVARRREGGGLSQQPQGRVLQHPRLHVPNHKLEPRPHRAG